VRLVAQMIVYTPSSVIPAQAGIHGGHGLRYPLPGRMDPRLRGDDGWEDFGSEIIGFFAA